MDPRPALTRNLRRRALVAAFGVIALLGSAVPTLAVDPVDRRPDALRRAPHPVDGLPASGAPGALIGHDVSWPQCNDPEMPAEFGFAIVGVNRGRVHSENPCLREQLAWAGETVDLYMNTANPGPGRSGFWPAGQSRPRACDTRRVPGDDTADCAYLYGWNAAADGYARALAAFVELGWVDADGERLPDGVGWWLDVETANSWRGNRALNVASLHGSVDYLESMGVAEVGFYSTPLLWWRVTATTDDFADYPAWHAGGHSRDEAERRCAQHRAFTGGELRMVQWIEGGIDTNLACEG